MGARYTEAVLLFRRGRKTRPVWERKAKEPVPKGEEETI